MKRHVLLTLVFVFLFIHVYSGSRDIRQQVLGIEKLYLTHKKTFIFKPEKNLKIKTLEGKRYQAKNYSYTENRIILNFQDTIDFDNIKYIQGKIYGDQGRKIAGGFSSYLAFPAGGFVMFIDTFSGGSGAIAAVPVGILLYSGIKVMGPRRFKLGKDYFLIVVQPESATLASVK